MVEHALADLGDGERIHVEAEAARLEPRQLQQVAHQLVHGRDDVAAALQELVLDVRVVDVARQDQLEVAAETGQRRSQLVRNGGDESSPLDVLRAQHLELALGRKLVGNQRDRGAGMSRERSRKAGLPAVRRGRVSEIEAEDHGRAAGDRNARIAAVVARVGAAETPGAAVG